MKKKRNGIVIELLLRHFNYDFILYVNIVYVRRKVLEEMTDKAIYKNWQHWYFNSTRSKEWRKTRRRRSVKSF